jgi:8-oxo-dGTP pyrophosphatase MutT (NUDIX family)
LEKGKKEDSELVRLVDRLRVALRGPLPGLVAQLRMVPERRRVEAVEPRQWRRAAVLVLLYPGVSGPSLPLTLRHAELREHAGQVSFPGGSLEEDEGIEDAALREAREEIGVDPGSIEILGRLTALRIPHSGFEIDPVLAWTPHPPRFVLEANEVAELIELPYARLVEPDAVGQEERELRGGRSVVPFWRAGGHRVWGATAMVLAELAAMVEAMEHESQQPD